MNTNITGRPDRPVPRPGSSKPLGQPRRSFGGSGRPQGGGRGKTPFPPKVYPNTIGDAKPQFISRNEEVTDRKSFASMSENRNAPGLPVKSVGKVLTQTVLNSFSPKEFPANAPIVRIIPMGGLNEVGLNMTALECGDDIIVIDTGFGFGGGDKYPGVDYVLPDIGYLEQNRHKIRGIIYTHGHLDHIGGAPYILPKLGSAPIFGMPFGLELLKHRLKEFNLDTKFKAAVIDPTKSLTLGHFKLQFFALNHSIPDVIGLCIDTPQGRILYCTDWKFDHTPFDNIPSDYAKIAQFGQEGVRLLMTDALGVMKPGYAPSERAIEANILEVVRKSEGRIILTSFASNVARMQAVINACVVTGRKLALSGRSMETNFNAAFRLAKIKVPKDLMVDLRQTPRMDPSKVCILSTGNQGEDAAALSRMARGEHNMIKLQGGDSVIFSSSPVPGNEAAVQDLMSNLTKIGVEVFHKPEYDIHISGHACEEDLKLMFSLAKPDFVQPIHGEHFMLVKAARLAAKMGVNNEHCLVGMNGRITEMNSKTVEVTDEIITDKYLMVDGSGIGTVSDVVLEERRQMNKEGSLILVMLLNKKKELVSGPEIISRGFVYMKNNQVLFDDIKADLKARYVTYKIDKESEDYFAELRKAIKQDATDIVYKRTEKMPMIIPVVVQV
jgi:ribonuclease J